MADEYLFYALDVKACFPGNGEELREAVFQYKQHISPKAVGRYWLLTPSGLNFVSDPAILRSFGNMTDHEILQIALCKTELRFRQEVIKCSICATDSSALTLVEISVYSLKLLPMLFLISIVHFVGLLRLLRPCGIIPCTP